MLTEDRALKHNKARLGDRVIIGSEAFGERNSLYYILQDRLGDNKCTQMLTSVYKRNANYV